MPVTADLAPPSYRNNDRQVVDDPALAAHLLQRLRPHVPATLQACGEHWQLHSLNERLRLCRYGPGQAFHTHQDGVHHRGAGLRSHLTFMVYLTDGDEFEGGDTLFYDQAPGAEPQQPVGRLRPRAGSLIVFNHALWHAGAVVRAGVKHIIRSDVLYQRTGPAADLPAGPWQPAHRGYVWTLAVLPGGRIASGGRDTVIRLWNAQGHGQGEPLRTLAPAPAKTAGCGCGAWPTASRWRPCSMRTLPPTCCRWGGTAG
jgi:hypothetical protein